MAYIGNRPVSGDNNSFRVLDDIKTHTFSFDGSSSSVVSTSDNTITHLGHRLVQGQRVTYTDGTGSAIGGLTDGTVYFVVINDANSFKLASSASNAAAGTGINLTSVGSGTAHTITVAFDGVNTKFKATFNNGTEADVTRVAQIQISLNNVIQQPQNTPTPTSGFGFESDSVIVFASAPASTVTFWGVLFANNFPTFEISDNDVDNFTGDGSKTDFTLSKSPASNENIIVTIDGVVQYPSDNLTTRAYNTVANTLQFSSAPANGADIQVRHIGFAGPDESGGVTAFYGRTGSVFLNNSDNIVVNNAEVAGNLTVQGDTTTLNTTLRNVELLRVDGNDTVAAGIITQRGSGDILKLYDTSSPVFVVKDGGRVGIGTDNPSAELDIEGATARIHLHDFDSNQSQISQSGNALYLNVDSEGNGNASFRMRMGGFTGDQEVLRVNNAGNVGINSNTPSEKLDVIGNIKSSGTITGSSFVGALPIANDVNNRLITASGSGGLNAEGGLLYDGTYFTHTGSGYKQLTVSTTTNNSVQFKLQNSVKNFSITNVAGGVFQLAEGPTTRFKLQDGVSFLDSTVGVGTNTLTNLGNSQVNIEGTAALTNHNQTLIIRDSVADDATGRGGNIGFGAYVDGTMRTLAAIGAFKKNSGTGFDGHLALYTRRNGVGPVDEVMRLESGGNVGIGTSSPETILTIAKNATNQTVATIPTVRLTNLDTTAVANDIVGSYEFFSKDVHSLNKVTGFMRNIPTDAGVNYDLSFGTIKTGDSNAVERLRITSSGEVRIADGGLLTINTDVNSNNYALQEAFRVDDGNSTADRALQIFEYHNNGTRWHSFNQNLDVTTTGSSYTYTQGNFGGSNMIEMRNGNLQIYSNPSIVSGGTSAITPTERIRLRSDGKVLIGSTLNADPYNDRKLTINSTSNNYLSIQSGDSSFSGIVFGHASGQSTDNFLTYVRHNNVDNKFAIHTNSESTPKVVITSDGKVGIGSITPERKLDVAGIVKIYGDSSGHGLRIDPDSTGGTHETLLGTPNGDLRLQAGNASYFASNANILLKNNKNIIINAENNGNVGIGSIPDERLHVVVTSATATVAKFERSHNNNVSIEYKNTTSRMFAGLAGDALGFAIDDDANLGVGPMFMVRRTTGYVGINTSLPKQQLEVFSGAAGRPTFRHTGGFGGLQIAGPQNASGAALMFTRSYDVVGGGLTTYSIHMGGGTQGLHFISGDPSEYETKTRLFLNSAGSVGINTRNPRQKLHLDNGTMFIRGDTAPQVRINAAINDTSSTRFALGLATGANNFFNGAQALDACVAAPSTGRLVLGVGSGARMYIINSGDVTIARTTSLGNAKLSVQCDSGSEEGIAVNLNQNSGISTAFAIWNNTGSEAFNLAQDAGSTPDLIFKIKNTGESAPVEKVRFTSDGKVGIGTDAGYGDAKLTVEGTAALTNNDTTLQIKDNVNDSAAGRGGNIGFSGYVNGTQRTFAGIGGLKSTSGTGNFAGHLALYTRVNGQAELDERLRITSDGKVGIGTDNPDELLHIFSESSHSKIVLESDNNSANNGLFWVDEGDNTQTEFYYSHPDNKQILKVNGNGFEIYSKQTSKVTAKIGHGSGYNDVVVPNGKLGVGTDNADRTLDVIGDVGVEGDLFLGQTSGAIAKLNGIGGNLDIFADGTIDFIESDNNKTMVTFDINTIHDDARIYMEGDVDTYFNHPDSNQLGFTIGGTDTMRLRSGKVGINETNPQNSLHISGSAPAIRFADTDANGSAFSIIEDNNGLLKLRNDAGNAGTGSGITLEVDGSEKVRITSDGNVGINSDSPSATLEIKDIGSTGPCILIRGATSTEGDITVPDGETFNFGHWNYSSSTFTERVRVSSAGLTTLKNFNGTGLKLEGANSDYQGIQLQVTDASASQTRNIFIDTVNETGAAVANQVGQIQSDGGSHWSWSTQAAGDRTDRRVERVRIKSDGKVGISSSSTGTAVVEYESGSSLPPNAVGGITVKVGDEQISNEIQLPRNGHIMVITGFSDAGGINYPQPQVSGMLYADVGISTNIRPMYTQGGTGADDTTNVGNDLVGRNTHTNTVSDCADGKITIMPGTSTGTIRICNREASTAYVFYLTFL